MNHVVSKFYDIESLGVFDENSVTKKFEKKLYFNGERYVCELPLKEHCETIPDNHSISMKRLTSLECKLRKNPQLFKTYDEIINEYIQNGIVEIVNDPGNEGSVHYLPHRAVIRNEKETTKVRIVFDASSKRRSEPSLNECLYSGPCLLPSLYDILLGFQIGKIAIVSDIQQAFLNVEIAKHHRDLLRFLWFKDFSNPSNQAVDVLRFTRVVFGLTSSPFLLNGTIAYHLSKYVNKNEPDDNVVSKLQKDLYVDDITTSVNSTDEALNFYSKSMSYFSEGGFKLRKWATNDPVLQRVIDENEEPSPKNDDITYAKDMLGIGNKYRKVLGINWDTSKDNLIFELNTIGENGLKLDITKRNILRISASYFDPVGFICPVVLQAKLLFKDICSMKTDWDDPVDRIISERWCNHLTDLKYTNDVIIPRYIYEHDDNVISAELHGYCDSSKDAYAAAVYIRARTSNDNIRTKLITAKSKVAPLKIESIPRLELMSCVLLSKLISSVKLALEKDIVFSREICWSDSEVALYWIKGVRRDWKPWIENRVNKIRNLVKLESWRHIPGDINPADLATREGKVDDLLVQTWWSGPNFLQLNEEDWPIQKEFNVIPKEVLDEAKKGSQNVININEGHNTLAALTIAKYDQMKISNLIEISKFSSLRKLCTVTAYVFRFINNLKLSIKKETRLLDDEVSVDELNTAEILWVRDAQLELRKSKTFSQISKSLRLYEDEDLILRSKTRLVEGKDVLDY